jgi:hypothetical protein
MTYPNTSPTVPGDDIVSPNSDPESDIEGNDLPEDDETDFEDDETEEDIIEDEDEEPDDEDIPLVDATTSR